MWEAGRMEGRKNRGMFERNDRDEKDSFSLHAIELDQPSFHDGTLWNTDRDTWSFTVYILRTVAFKEVQRGIYCLEVRAVNYCMTLTGNAKRPQAAGVRIQHYTVFTLLGCDTLSAIQEWECLVWVSVPALLFCQFLFFPSFVAPL